MDDWDLLRSYANDGSEDAFAELVHRHLDLVYSVALRKLGDAHAASDVAQSVFCLLARKAPRLKPGGSLAGWLFRTACYRTSEHLRDERRRRAFQDEVVMETQNAQPEPEAAWEQLAPLLDEALQELNDADRTSVLLRFFEQKPLRQVGLALGVDEDAARKRVSRAVERLRGWFARKGVTCSSSALVAAVSANAVHAAPAELGSAISHAVFAATTGATTAVSVTQSFPLLAAMTSAKTITLTAVALGLLLSIPVALHLSKVNRTATDSSARGVAGQLDLIGPFTAAFTNRVGNGQTLVVGGGIPVAGWRAFMFFTPTIEPAGPAGEPRKVTMNSQGVAAPDRVWEQLGWNAFKLVGRTTTNGRVFTPEEINAVFAALRRSKAVDFTNVSPSTVDDGERTNFGWGMSGGNGQIVDVFRAVVYPRITPDGRSLDLDFRPSPPPQQTADSGR